VRYDDECEHEQTCTILLEVEEDMKSPVFLYYELRDFYQNHFNFVKSRDYLQLRGEDRSESELEATCGSVTLMSDIPVEMWGNDTDITLERDDIAKPCGLAAKYYPQDTFEIAKVGKRPMEIEFSDLAWQADLDAVYEMSGDNATYWLDIEDGEC
jgi:hypothetical protein